MQQKIQNLKNHTVVCGYGRNGKQAVAKLIQFNQPCVVIEKRVDEIAELEKDNILFIEGDATNDDDLAKVGLERAKSLITALPSDADNLFTLRPVLACDVINNPVVVANLNKGLKNATWLEVEHDFFIIPQSANDGGPDDQLLEQSTNVQINGFNNKHLERILIVKEIGDASLEQSGGSTSGFGKFSSQCCYKQKLQFRVNGRNVLPRNGIVGNNERLAHIVDAFGECSAYISSNQYGLNATLELTDGRDLMGQLDYMGMYIGEDISNLQINYSRVGLEDTTPKRPTTQTLKSHVYGEVRKSLIVGGPGQGYVIRYM